MLLPGIPELHLYGAFDRGVPNAERVVIRATQRVQMAQFGVLLGRFNPTAPIPTADPIVDFHFWFGDGIIEKDEWIFLYTGPGTPIKSTTKEPEPKPCYVIYWNRDSTLFANSFIVPILVRIGGVVVGLPPPDLRQAALPSASTSS